MKRFNPKYFHLFLAVLFLGFSGLASAENLPSDDLCQVLVPSAISPNGDGINDYLEIKADCHFESCTFRLYDSRSRVIFETTQLDKPWDATLDGKIVAEGHYMWEFTYQEPNSNANKTGTQRGMLTIIR